MASTAISAQGSKLYIGTGSGSAKTVTAAAAGNPTIITATSHGFSNGDVVTLAGSSGATGLNATFVVRNKTTNTFSVDFDSTGDTITWSSGTATPVTWSQFVNVNTVKGPDGSAKEIDVTNLDSTAVEVVLGLADNGNISVEMQQDDSNAAQAAADTARTAGTLKNFKIVLPAGSYPTGTFSAYVKKFDKSLGVNDVVKRSMDLRVSGAVTWA